ncbi:hypothetical protein FS749_008574 [Ceratobasidium sp. UAMH 11750]|nr:hypothetical protein FS749_008574 [Ceratobasidium sp. UAMH 11750]
MGMASGLYQRRSIGFSDQYVFGTAFHGKQWLSVFAGSWVNGTSLHARAKAPSSAEKIVIYTLGSFCLTSTVDMFRYYLLMRETRRLTLEYKASIEGHALELAASIARSHSGIHSWPPQAEQGRGTSSLERKKATPALGAQATQLNDVVGLGEPFMHHHAGELGEIDEDEKVRGYLLSSIHHDYEYRVDDS